MILQALPAQVKFFLRAQLLIWKTLLPLNETELVATPEVVNVVATDASAFHCNDEGRAHLA